MLRGANNVGLFFNKVPKVADVTAAVHAPAGTMPGVVYPASLTPNSLETVWMPDILGDDSWPCPTRAQAVSVPAVAAARNLIVGQISRLPLEAVKDGVKTADQPTWLYRTNGALSPQMRMAFTVDDLLFYGWSFWLVERGADGFITEAQRCPIDQWRFNSKMQVVVGQGDTPIEDGILFSGPIPGGFLSTGARTIRQALDMESTRAQRLRNPSAVTEIHQTEDNALTDEELEAVRDNYANARRHANGAIVVTPSGIEVIDHDSGSVEMFTTVANALSVAVAQHLGLPAATIDAAVNGGGTSFNYSSTALDRSWFIGTGLHFWADAITSRLSMDDCVARGTVVRFDLEPLQQPEYQD
jgi:hypothetical protein